MALAIVNHARGHPSESDAALSNLIDEFHANAAYRIAEACAWRGEVIRSFEWIEWAYAQRDPGLAHLPADRLLRSLRSAVPPALEDDGITWEMDFA